MVLAELDVFVNNSQLAMKFEANRRAGGLWSAALEPGVPHHFLSAAQQQVTLRFIVEFVRRRSKVGYLASFRRVGQPMAGFQFRSRALALARGCSIVVGINVANVPSPSSRPFAVTDWLADH
jgi:hypothetical protein